MTRAALILAAGAARRFGSPKQLVRYEGTPLLQRTINQLAPLFGDALYVVLGAHADQIEYTLSGARVFRHHNWSDGIGSSIAAGVRHVRQNADPSHLLIALADQPKVLTSDYEMLRHASVHKPRALVAARYSSSLGVPAIFPARLFEALEALGGDAGAKCLMTPDHGPIQEADLPAAAFDVDRPEDLDRS